MCGRRDLNLVYQLFGFLAVSRIHCAQVVFDWAVLLSPDCLRNLVGYEVGGQEFIQDRACFSWAVVIFDPLMTITIFFPIKLSRDLISPARGAAPAASTKL